MRVTTSAPSIDTALVKALRRRFDEIGFGETGIRNASDGVQDPWSLAVGQPARDDSPFSTVVSLFWSGSPVDGRKLESALTPLRLEDLEALGLVEIRGGLAHPLCLIRPGDGLMIASDIPSLRADCVLGVSPASQTLSMLTVRKTAKRALDMGTGCGVQALLLARHSEMVVSTDVNPRALTFTRFNAALNEWSNVELREGSWFDPVGGELFDVIACNPPYVISPDADYTYRDSGLPRDGVSRMVIGNAARHLANGGFATVLCNWVHEESWIANIRNWVTDTGCDALLLHFATVDAAPYAARWNLEMKTVAPDLFNATVRRWMEYYRAEGISQIGFGAVILRRRQAASHWVRALNMATGPTCPSRDHILRLFAAADFLETQFEGLLRQTFKLVDGHRIDQTLTYPAGKYVVGPAVFRSYPGIGIETHVDARALEILLECDGRRSLDDLATDAANRMGEPKAVIAELVEEPVRKLVEHGFMIPIINN